MEVNPAFNVSQLPSIFSEEPLTLEWCNEALPLLVEHYKEIAHYKDIDLNINFSYYLQNYDLGHCKLFSARDTNGTLIGYACYIISPNPHYQSSIQAKADVIYIDPRRRGMGGRFISWCDDRLREAGVQVVYHHVKLAHNFGPLLERMGYEAIEINYAKRLDK